MNQSTTIVPVRGYESILPPTSKRTHIGKSTLFSADEDDDSNLSYDPAEENGDDYDDAPNFKEDTYSKVNIVFY